ncbi:MAG: helix-turn-helix transcriptional regulator [Bacteroidota bacterium]|jgi:transcriptional regulator with XRE-family HTH domain
MIIDSIKLKRIRESKKMSQAQIAEAIGFSQSTYWEWEQTDHNVKLENVLKLCEVLNTEITDISKDATTINIINNQNNKKDNSQAVVGFDIKITQDELMQEIKLLRGDLDKFISAMNTSKQEEGDVKSNSNNPKGTV